jgi:hypothetical protein
MLERQVAEHAVVGCRASSPAEEGSWRLDRIATIEELLIAGQILPAGRSGAVRSAALGHTTRRGGPKG